MSVMNSAYPKDFARRRYHMTQATERLHAVMLKKHFTQATGSFTRSPGEPVRRVGVHEFKLVFDFLGGESRNQSLHEFELTLSIFELPGGQCHFRR